MGASLSVKLTQTGKNEESRTGAVNVVVTITSTAGTHNHFGDSDLGQGTILYVTIDGNTYSSYVIFGSSETGTFTSTVYSNTFTVSYTSAGTKTVSVNARCVTGTSAGTISGSNSLSLTPISAGGSSGGGDGGDGEEGGDEWDPDNPGTGGGGSSIVYPDFTGNVPVWQYPGLTSYIGNDGWDYYAACIFFNAPAFTGKSTSVDVAIKARYDESSRGSQTIGIALCSSPNNHSLYPRAGVTVDDEYQIAATTMTIVNDGFGTVNIPTTELKSDTPYYFILWIPTNYASGGFYYLDDVSEYRVRVNYTADGGDSGGEDSGDSGGDSGGDDSGGGDGVVTPSERGVFYIDNGSAFDEYECFLDNGTDWVQIGAPVSNLINTGEVTTDDNGIAYVNCGFVPDIIILTRGEQHPYLGENYVGNLVISLPVPAYDGFTTYSSGILRAPSIRYDETSLEIFVAGMDTDDGVGAYLYVCSIDYLTDGSGSEYNPESTTLNYTAIKYT